jgi:hypothetical protein
VFEIASVVVYILAFTLFYQGRPLQSIIGIFVAAILAYTICYVNGILPGVGPFANC